MTTNKLNLRSRITKAIASLIGWSRNSFFAMFVRRISRSLRLQIALSLWRVLIVTNHSAKKLSKIKIMILLKIFLSNTPHPQQMKIIAPIIMKFKEKLRSKGKM
jgi:hypothetical protein